MKKIYSLFTSLAIAFTVSSTVNAQDAVVVNYDNTATQGDTVVINLETEKKLLNPSFQYKKGKKIKLYKVGDNKYRGILGIAGMEKPGNYNISLRDNSGNLNINKRLKVLSGNYPPQYIKLSGKKSGLKLTKNELRKIVKGKKSLIPVAQWHKPPFKMPCEGCISSLYGLKRYYNGKASGSYHKGIDIATSTGTPINAFTNGKVVLAEQLKFHGGTVSIDHGQGIVSMYLHMSKIDVKKGEIVNVGDKIGEVGSTGISTGPHLHFGLYVNGIPVDPTKYWGTAPMICKD